jgi:Tol biopolymer transport system component
VTPSNSAGQAADLKDLLKSECGHFVYEEPYGAMFSVALDGSGARIINPDPPFPLSLSADASLMAYDRRIQSEGRWSLVLFDVAQQQERELGEGGTPGLSPSGKMLAYWSDGLVVMNLKTGEQRKVYDANPSDVVQPAWSPDETRIAFLARSETGDTSDNLETDLIVVDLRTDASATIAKPDGLWPGSPVAWSPDGSRIAFADSHLHLVSADGSDRHNYLIDAESVAWSPSGDMLVIRDSGKISLVDPKSGIETWLTSDAGGVVTIPPAWSPDGRLFAYASLRDELVVMDVATRATITVLPNANEPRWISQGCPSP